MRPRSNLLQRLAIVVAVLALGTLLASVPVVGSYQSRAILAQRVEVDKAAADLFGEESNKPIGSPQHLIIEDPKAIVGEAGPGVKMVDEGYLREKGIYPLQLKTVEFVASLVRLGAGAALLLALGVLFLGRRTRPVAALA